MTEKKKTIILSSACWALLALLAYLIAGAVIYLLEVAFVGGGT